MNILVLVLVSIILVLVFILVITIALVFTNWNCTAFFHRTPTGRTLQYSFVCRLSL